MNNAQAGAKQQQRVEELCAGAIRALSGEPDLHFRGRHLHRGRQRVPVRAPHLHPSFEDDDFGSFRGAADGMALRLTRSHTDLHRTLCPAEPVERLVFEMLEQFRVESLASLQGVIDNLRHRHVRWSLGFHQAGLTETARGLLLYTVAQVARSRVTAQPVVQETEDLLEATRFALAPMLGHDFAALRRHRHDQSAYAEHALAIARTVSGMLQGAEKDSFDGKDPNSRTAFPLFVDPDEDTVDPIATAATGHSRVLAGAEHGYRVFTTAYDQQHAVSTLVRPAQLKAYREQLDQQIAQHGVNVHRLAREVQLLLAEPAHDGWDGGQEHGHIDGRRLTQLISSPTERRLFRTERVEPVAHCLVTFLIDCSGSMKEHAESVAVIVDVFGQALELAGASSEILGFTTGAWNGGRALRDWRRSGRPHHPGRLNELCHLVFKDADTPWRRARPTIAALLQADLFREGVDGEAVAWACRRMEGRTEQRRLLIVLSDGSPMDTATNLTNDNYYLDNHLKDVVGREEAAGSAQIYGLGVGLDLSPYYGRSHALDLSHGLGNGLFREVLEMIAGHRRR